MNNLQLDKFNSKLKFYFSLLFIDQISFKTLEKYFGNDINVFHYNEDNFLETDIDALNEIFDNITWINNRIPLEDNVLIRLFTKEELIKNQKLYLMDNEYLDVNNPIEIENFLCYSMLQKVREKKAIKKGTIYDFYNPCTNQEIKRAIANLNGYDHEGFTMYFGINYDKEVIINSNDRVRNDLLIKLYIYILSNREDEDVSLILKMNSKDLVKEHDLFDYIRSLCNDPTLSNEFIGKIIMKLDYDSKLFLKLTYGKDYKDKKKAPEEDLFKNIIKKVVKEVEKQKPKKKRKEKKKEEPKQEKQKEKKKEEKPKQEKKKEKKKEEKPKQEKQKKKEEPKKKKVKPKKEDKKQNKKEEIKKTKKETLTDKKERINRFLSEYGIDKKDFLLAVALLDSVSKKIVELYFGLEKDKDPIDMDEIAYKIGKSVEITWDIFETALERIVNLVKSGEIYKTKKIEPVETVSNKLSSYVKENNIKEKEILKVTKELSPLFATVISLYMGLNNDNKSPSEIAKKLNRNEKSINKIINESSDIIISKLSELNKEDKKEEAVEVKKEKKEKKEIKEKKEEKQEEPKPKKEAKKVDKPESLSDFLKDNGLTRDEFNYGYKQLDSYGKRVISLYFSGYTIEEIAKKYNMTKEETKKILDKSKEAIIKAANELKNEKSNMTLTKFLNDNGIKLADFNKYFKSLPASSQNILSMYLGLNGKALTVKEIARRMYRSESSINQIIKQCANEIKQKTNTKTKTASRLNEFLKQNNLTKEKLMIALEGLSAIEKTVILLYLGVNGKERQIGQIATALGLNKVDVIDIISRAKNQILLNAKPKEKKSDIIEKAKDAYKTIMSNKQLHQLLLTTNQIGLSILSMAAEFNGSIEQLSRMIGLPESQITNILESTIALCDNQKDIKIDSKKNDQATLNYRFEDQPTKNNKDKSR